MALKTTVIEAGGKELGKKEIAIIKTSLQSCIDINQATADGNTLAISVLSYAVLEIENDRSKGEKVYKKIVIIDTDGKMYITGSPSFIENFSAIMEAMEGEDPDTWGIEIFQMPSNTYKGKNFITCKVV